jgi:hypothetical protein
MAAEIFFPLSPLDAASELILQDDLTALDCLLIGTYFADLKEGRQTGCPETVQWAEQCIKELYDLTGATSGSIEIRYHLN